MKTLKSLYASVLVPLCLFNTQVLAHPGHSHFGSADEESGWILWAWLSILLIMACLGAWRLYRIFSTARQKKHDAVADTE